ncbi:Hypothetical predicted protein [Cloeon dipterum]|uniref:WD repeat-containing protein 76 n=1 Tax=Cloeon dipterum TaxID=197152 RepID=A0A8S1C5X8_9INSE|nr:Hypothetical predicted protein [Cloeon dipterum]
MEVSANRIPPSDTTTRRPTTLTMTTVQVHGMECMDIERVSRTRIANANQAAGLAGSIKFCHLITHLKPYIINMSRKACGFFNLQRDSKNGVILNCSKKEPLPIIQQVKAVDEISTGSSSSEELEIDTTDTDIEAVTSVAAQTVVKRTRGRPTKTTATAQVKQMKMSEEDDPDARQGEKSDLEIMRERNISMRKNMIKDIGLLDAKEAFEETLKKRQQNKVKEKVVDSALPVTRESRSLRRTEAAAATESLATLKSKDLLGETLSLNQCLASFSNLKDLQMFIETAQSIEKASFAGDVGDSELSSMQFSVMKSRLCTLLETEFCLPEIASRFTSLAFHPSRSPLLLAGGNKNGCVCLWSLPRELSMLDNQLCAFQAHTDDVNHIQIGANYPHFLYTSSSDGSVKCLDINKQQFTLCYKLPIFDESDAVLNWHALSGPSVLLAASSGGQLLRLDTRDGSVAEFNCHTSSINTVDICGGNLVLTASRDTFVSVWDVRYMNLQGSGDGSINSGRLKYVKLGFEAVSAFFSVGGSRLLVTTKERISVYDHAPNMDPFNTFSGTGNFIESSRSRELVPKAFWHPLRKDVLVVGGAQGPVGGVHVFHAKHSSRPGVAVPANFVIKGELQGISGSGKMSTQRRSIRLKQACENLVEPTETNGPKIIKAVLKRKSVPQEVTPKDRQVLSPDESSDDEIFKNSEDEDDSLKENDELTDGEESKVKEEMAKVDEVEDNEQETEVERMRKKNIEERQKMFEQLKLGQLKQEMETRLSETTQHNSTPRRSSLFSSSRTPDTPSEPVRKSARLLGLEAKKLELPEERHIRVKDSPTAVCRKVNSSTGKMSIANFKSDWGNGVRDSTPVLSLEDALHGGFFDKDNNSLLLDMCLSMRLGSDEDETCLKEDNCSTEQFKRMMNSLTLKEHHKMKVVPARVYSLAFNPLTSGFMVAAGCKSGAVGLWKINPESTEWDETKVVAFDYHAKPTNCITFGEKEPHLMYTTSYDGTFRRGDLQKQEFSLLYETPPCRKDNHTCWHVEMQPGVFLLGVGDGSIAQIDAREDPTKRTDCFRCHDRSLRTISVHPGSGTHFATTSSFNKEVAIWDLRAMSKKRTFSGKLSSIEFPKTLSSAFFSPVTGDALLTTSADDLISVYDTSSLHTPSLVSKVAHNNHTGRWITNFRAVWHPQREDVCLVGSMDRPQRKLQLFQVAPKIKPLTNLAHAEFFTTIGAVAVFHPYLPAVAAANASGYVHIFM